MALQETKVHIAKIPIAAKMARYLIAAIHLDSLILHSIEGVVRITATGSLSITHQRAYLNHCINGSQMRQDK